MKMKRTIDNYVNTVRKLNAQGVRLSGFLLLFQAFDRF